MSDKNDGGPAFAYGDKIHGGNSGMSLRDYFAGQALAGLTTTCLQRPSQKDLDLICEISYWHADAMLKARGA